MLALSQSKVGQLEFLKFRSTLKLVWSKDYKFVCESCGTPLSIPHNSHKHNRNPLTTFVGAVALRYQYHTTPTNIVGILCLRLWELWHSVIYTTQLPQTQLEFFDYVCGSCDTPLSISHNSHKDHKLHLSGNKATLHTRPIRLVFLNLISSLSIVLTPVDLQ